jgi:ferrous iron transport protein B
VTRIVLVGQPNCGKSTLFNRVAGYKAVVSNFPGTTVDFTRSQVSVNGQTVELVDIPGIYSLSSQEPDEQVAIRFLYKKELDVIINIVDSSILSRSLELTLELMELNTPMVLCLNMMDEARRKGVHLEVSTLEEILGIPVVPTIASRGEGLKELFQRAIDAAQKRLPARGLHMSLDVEEVISSMVRLLENKPSLDERLPDRMVALKLLEGDPFFMDLIRARQPGLFPQIRRLCEELSSRHGRPPDVVISSERHSLAVNIFERVARVRPRGRRSPAEELDRLLMHPVWGYVCLGLILFMMFNGIFGFGKMVEEPLLGLFDSLSSALDQRLDTGHMAYPLLRGVIQGFSGGVAIVLPYLIPFLVGLALLEDMGYLPRAAYLMDAIMHKMGLHGKALIPFVLGYGCNVPAIMGVKILESRRDRLITSILVCFIPCAARTTIIFALAAFYLGPNIALMLYLLNLLVIGLMGGILSKIMPEVSPGMILEIPTYRMPDLRSVIWKVWFRLREFIVLAWPLLIAGSVILGLLEYYRLFDPVNGVLSPFTSSVLGLPSQTGIPLIFGILRKELSLIMLVQALGTTDFSQVMSKAQILVFTVFSIFYMPCLATMAMIQRVTGKIGALMALFITTAVATILAVVSRLGISIF